MRGSSRRFELSTRGYLLVLAAAFLIPGVVFTAIVLYRFAEAERSQYQAAALHASERIAAAVDREFSGLEAALQTLSTGRSFGERAYDRFYERALEVKRIIGADIILKDETGQQVVNTRVPFETALPISLHPHEKLALETDRTQISGLHVGVFSQQRVISLALPVNRDGHRHLLVIAISPDRLSDVLNAQALPARWVASIIDGTSTIVARTGESRHHVGKTIVLAPKGAQNERYATWEGRTLDGQAALLAFVRPHFADAWSVTVGIPLEIAHAPLYQAIVPLAVAGALTLLASLTMAGFAGARSGRAMGLLAQNAAALGTHRPLMPLQTRIREVNRVSTALVGASRDLAERERERCVAEDALRRLNERLEAAIEERSAQLVQLQKLESLGQLTGGVAHDFNNLLMAILGSLELLKKRLKGDPRADRLIDNAVQGARRGATLTQRLLAFARKQDLAPTAVDVPALVQGMSDLLRRSVGPRIELDWRLPPDLPAANVDANQLELAVLNLAVNARDAMPLGGRITLDARLEQGFASDPAQAGRGHIVLAIADDGTGMDEATLRRAAEPFFTTKGVGKGTGLGLSMVHGLAEQSGGRLVLSSAEGTGRTAELWLPIADRPADADTRSPIPSEQKHSASRRILVVDDDPLVLASTGHLLDDLGHVVLEASSGRQALDMIAYDDPVDLVITDYAMPGITGTELIERIRARLPEMPIIMATGYAEAPDAQASVIRLGKPFTQSALATALHQTLGPPVIEAVPLPYAKALEALDTAPRHV